MDLKQGQVPPAANLLPHTFLPEVSAAAAAALELDDDDISSRAYEQNLRDLNEVPIGRRCRLRAVFIVITFSQKNKA